MARDSMTSSDLGYTIGCQWLKVGLRFLLLLPPGPCDFHSPLQLPGDTGGGTGACEEPSLEEKALLIGGDREHAPPILGVSSPPPLNISLFSSVDLTPQLPYQTHKPNREEG